jgi:hypothetical protein
MTKGQLGGWPKAVFPGSRVRSFLFVHGKIRGRQSRPRPCRRPVRPDRDRNPHGTVSSLRVHPAASAIPVQYRVAPGICLHIRADSRRRPRSAGQIGPLLPTKAHPRQRRRYMTFPPRRAGQAAMPHGLPFAPRSNIRSRNRQGANFFYRQTCFLFLGLCVLLDRWTIPSIRAMPHKAGR